MPEILSMVLDGTMESALGSVGNAIVFPTLAKAPATILTTKDDSTANAILLKPLHQEVINMSGEGINELRQALGSLGKG